MTAICDPELKLSESSDESMNEDVWDDSLLIKAYDKAINYTKEKIAAKMSVQNGLSCKKKPENVTTVPQGNNEWKVGMPCRAVYSEDGKEYEATVKSISPDRRTCEVTYVGYNNSEEVATENLKPSNGPQARKMQTSASVKSATNAPDSNTPSSNYFYTSDHAMNGIIPPPPPPQIMSHFPRDESDALSAMLMSWYMSGYHTGYYQGLTKAKTSRP